MSVFERLPRRRQRSRPTVWAALVGLCILGVVLYNHWRTYQGHLAECKLYGVMGDEALRECATDESKRLAIARVAWEFWREQRKQWFHEQIRRFQMENSLPDTHSQYTALTIDELHERYQCCPLMSLLQPDEVPIHPAYGKRFALTGTLVFAPHDPHDELSDGDRFYVSAADHFPFFSDLHVDLSGVSGAIRQLIRSACEEGLLDGWNLCTDVTLYGVIDAISRPGHRQRSWLGLKVEHISFQPQPQAP